MSLLPRDGSQDSGTRSRPNYESPEDVAAPGTAAYTHWSEALRSVLPGPPARVLGVGTGTGFVAQIAAFERYYTPEPQAKLTAMHLIDHDYLLQVAAAAGFRDLRTIALEMVQGWETSPSSDLPYALVGYRASRHDKEIA